MPYYRQPSISFGPPITRMVKYLVIFTSAVFAVTYLPAQIRDGLRLTSGWAFDPTTLRIIFSSGNR